MIVVDDGVEVLMVDGGVVAGFWGLFALVVFVFGLVRWEVVFQVGFGGLEEVSDLFIVVVAAGEGFLENLVDFGLLVFVGGEIFIHGW